MRSPCRTAMGLSSSPEPIEPTSALAVSRSPFTSARTVGATPGEQLAYCARAARCRRARAARSGRTRAGAGRHGRADLEGHHVDQQGLEGEGLAGARDEPKEWKSVARIKAESR